MERTDTNSLDDTASSIAEPASGPELTLCVLTRNEERNLTRLLPQLASLPVDKEILVVDSFSTDGTCALAQATPGTRVAQNVFEDFAKQRNFAIEQSRGRWILMIDADEMLSEELAAVLVDGALFHREGVDVYDIPRRNYLMGRWLRCTYPDYQRRLFRNKGYRFIRSVHERLDVPEADAVRLDAPLDHRPNTGLRESVDTLNSYTDREVAERAPGMTSRWIYAKLFFSPLAAFVKAYVLKRGYRDGTPGLIWSGFELFYKFVLIAKVIEARGREGRDK